MMISMMMTNLSSSSMCVELRTKHSDTSGWQPHLVAIIIINIIIIIITIIIIIIIIIVNININIIIIIITRPRPAFGRLGLGGSSRGYSSRG